MPTQLEREARIAELRHTLLTQYGVEEKDIPLYLRGLRAHNAGRPLGKVFLPKGKISFEDFDEKEQMLLQGTDKLLKEISEEDLKIDAYDAKLKTWLGKEREMVKSAKTNSERVVSTLFNTLAGYDMQFHDLFHLKPIDANKFYADIAPLLNELNALLCSQAHARRNGEP